MPEADDLALLREAAEAAGEIALRYFRQDPKSWDKADGQGPVTEADLEIDEMLRTRLLAARPGYGWLSEETEDGEDRLGRERVFIVDPIDGTRAFAAGTSAFSHALAIAENGVPVAGVVFLPAQERLFSAAAGAGATLNGERIAVAAGPGKDGVEILASRPVFEPRHWPGGVPDAARVFRPSLAYRLCLVAQGRFDAMVTFGRAWEWDIAAGALIAQEAGALVTDRHGETIRFNSPDPAHRGCIAAAPGYHGELMRRHLRAG